MSPRACVSRCDGRKGHGTRQKKHFVLTSTLQSPHPPTHTTTTLPPPTHTTFPIPLPPQNNRSSKYHKVEKRYREAKIKCDTTQMAVEDLHKYHKALDRALMRYHRMKVRPTRPCFCVVRVSVSVFVFVCGHPLRGR
jgi:hypothetical protein